MNYQNTTDAEFGGLAALIFAAPCLYSVISNFDWHVRLCFVRTYDETVGRKGRVIKRGGIEIITDAADWFLFDTRRFPNRRLLLASNVEYGYGNKDHDYFSGHVWRLDLSRLPQLVLQSDGLLLEAYANENAMEDHECWNIIKEAPNATLFYCVTETTVKRKNGTDPC